MKPRKKRSEKQWCAPEHCKRDCSWKGEKLATTKYAGAIKRDIQRIDGTSEEMLTQLQCGIDYKHAVEFCDDDLGCKRKRYLKNGIIIEERR